MDKSDQVLNALMKAGPGTNDQIIRAIAESTKLTTAEIRKVLGIHQPVSETNTTSTTSKTTSSIAFRLESLSFNTNSSSSIAPSKSQQCVELFNKIVSITKVSCFDE
ncbi:uncharacterized protein LOC119661914 isoform X2 [Teleopsis dalmanni]|uniref:uncharacterized protein LOC119661914 isoform X2 n=1 Tax=Teleopsis dalmanni TaxID=139649 RepID=UPI0018CE67DD|nr:uncharacterized protein LOC119661914 isoform X2 [Teleopsis dalmanni]